MAEREGLKAACAGRRGRAVWAPHKEGEIMDRRDCLRLLASAPFALSAVAGRAAVLSDRQYADAIVIDAADAEIDPA